MPLLRAAAPRIPPPTRPLRPPARHRPSATPRRPFARRPALLHFVLTSGTHARPQVPFLSASRGGAAARGGWRLLLPPARQRVARLFSHESRRTVRHAVWLASIWTAFGWTAYGLLLLSMTGVRVQMQEADYPSPTEWRLWTRVEYSNFRAAIDELRARDHGGVVEWPSVATQVRSLIRRLEDQEKEGKGLKEDSNPESYAIKIPSLFRKAGYNITEKSRPWRESYFEVLMGMARCAEHLDGWAFDTSRGGDMFFPPQEVIGPSNPHPVPPPPGRPSPAPREEDCIPLFPSPELVYRKILSTKGLETRQRLEAILGLGEWLSFKGKHEEADGAFRSALELAGNSLPVQSPAERDAVIDPTTGVIRADAPVVTRNMCAAATALAAHQASVGNAASALPIFLSVLRARKAADPSLNSADLSFSSQTSSGLTTQTPDLITSPNRLDKFKHSIFSFFAQMSYPPPPPTGDEPLSALLPSPQSSFCDAAELMTYVGEILFARADREAGIAWTRDAVALVERGRARERAERGAGPENEVPGAQRERRREHERCTQCVGAALDNWRDMVGLMAEEERKERMRARRGWGEWLGLSKASEAGDAGESAEKELGRWEVEELRVMEKVRDHVAKVSREETMRTEANRPVVWVA
ncbi:hypothetical protein BDY21DRAFT_329032 [Lineolata rhizophorae]|uniref:MFS maltose permease n=1 Tax=Lineolata rhizophorae TaxID=578093 RepID=A0A6A6NLN1_9PEZI|nr:hypothetical protein BDY21DRAFT_329032 [Lineolata rhizophorae]